VTDGQLRLTPGARVPTGTRGEGSGRTGGRGGGRARRQAAIEEGNHEFRGTFIRRPVATTLLVATILIFGIMGYRLLPVSDSADGRLPDDPGGMPACPARARRRWRHRWRRRSKSSSRRLPA
jgi:hypothetical protein